LRASFAQERFWLLQGQHREGTAYNLAVAIALEGPLDAPALARAVTEMIRRHEILRTTLALVDGVLIQRILPAAPVALPEEEVPAARLAGWARAHAGARFDLGAGPLVRIRLARATPAHHCLLVCLHHAIFDLWSFEIFMEELAALYGASRGGNDAPREDPPLQYADYAVWQRRAWRGPAHDAGLTYWKQQLAGDLPELRLPADGQRAWGAGQVDAPPGASARTRCPAALWADLTRLARDEGTTSFVLCVAALAVLLHRHADVSDVVIATPVAGRERASLQRMLGAFVNTVAIRADLSGRPTFRALLARVRGTAGEALAHAGVPFEQVIRALRDEGRPDPAAALTRVLFAFQNAPRSGWSFPDLRARAWNIEPAHAKAELAFTAQEDGDGTLGVLLEYDATLFEAATAEGLLRRFRVLLEGIARHPERSIAELPLLDDEEPTSPRAGSGSAQARDVELERALVRCPQVARARVSVEADRDGKRLVAAVVPALSTAGQSEDVVVSAIEAHLRARLPQHLLPAEIVLVEALPLTAAGERGPAVMRSSPPPPARRSRETGPCDPWEQRVLASFERVLRREGIGVDDDFFGLGGDSLSALSLISSLERELDRPVALAMLYQHPSVATLAEALRPVFAETWPVRPGLALIKSGRTTRPLFLAPGGHGGKVELMVCAKLVSALDADEAVLGLLASPDVAEVGAMAEEHLVSLREAQPRGPYRIGGQCIGGLVAYEMAQRLRARGEEVELLVLFETWCPTPAGVLHYKLLGHPRAMMRAGLAFMQSLPSRDPEAEPWVAELLRRARPPLAARRRIRAALSYRPAAYPGPMLLVASDDSVRRDIVGPWRTLVAELAVETVPGDHESYSRQHHRRTAERVRAALERRKGQGGRS
jgi:thioesterase domain-containing protein/acyl carrier protein